MVTMEELEAEYCAAGQDTVAEQEAYAWIEVEVEDALPDEPAGICVD